MWGLLADITVEVHLAYLLFAALGGLLALRNPVWAVPHLLTVTWGIVVVWAQWDCPITLLEKWLIEQSGEVPYSGAFVDRYVFGVYLPEGSQPYAFVFQLTFFVVVYALVVRRLLRRRVLPVGMVGTDGAGSSAAGRDSELAGDVGP
jgi:hypothetical protein